MPQRLAKAAFVLSTMVAGFSAPILEGSLEEYLNYRALARDAGTPAVVGLYTPRRDEARNIALGSGALEIIALYAGVQSYRRVRNSLQQ